MTQRANVYTMCESKVPQVHGCACARLCVCVCVRVRVRVKCASERDTELPSAHHFMRRKHARVRAKEGEAPYLVGVDVACVVHVVYFQQEVFNLVFRLRGCQWCTQLHTSSLPAKPVVHQVTHQCAACLNHKGVRRGTCQHTISPPSLIRSASGSAERPLATHQNVFEDEALDSSAVALV